ncbi:selection and upkeep of intraepithelial T-cells 2-like [Solea senegalensis]|nr:selection and upkeep of intraepithelial T-cells 2-like [Solea senegalensis]
MMGLLSGVRELHVSGWILVIWRLSAASIAGSQDVKLQVTPQVVSKCGENVTLTCTASSSRQLDIKLFSWNFKIKPVCQYGENRSDAEVVCESTADASHHNLTLTLMNVMPVNAGKYLCKLQSKVGAKYNSTVVAMQGCLEKNAINSINESHVGCWFTGVYPSSTIHWFCGDVNLTDSTSTKEEEDQHGRFSVSSNINVQKGNASLSYKCSLWMPSKGKYVSSRLLNIPRKIQSSGSTVRLQWICGVVWIIYFLVGKAEV